MYHSLSALALVAALLTPTPPAPVQAPVNPEPPATARVVDLTGQVLDAEGQALDIGERVANLDESVTNETSGAERKITVAADVLFAFDRATLGAKARSRLAQAASVLRAEAGGKRVRVSGYTDAKGSAPYNLRLSRQRAQAVRQALGRLLGSAGITFTVEGRGAADPVAPNASPDGADSPEGRAKNRRVEISFAR